MDNKQTHYNQYRQHGKEYLCRTTLWRHNRKHKQPSEEQFSKATKVSIVSYPQNSPPFSTERGSQFRAECTPQFDQSDPAFRPDCSPRNIPSDNIGLPAEVEQQSSIDFDLLEIQGKSKDDSTNQQFQDSNLLKFIQSDGFFESLNLNVKISKAELFFMLVKFCKQNQLSKAATANLFKLINILFPGSILPETEYLLDKLLNEGSDVQFHYICHNCTAYVGRAGEIENDLKKCYNCEVALDIFNPSKQSYFVLIDPSVQITDLLNLHKQFYLSVLKNSRVRDGIIRDVYDGHMYINFINSLSAADRHAYASLCFNSDGAEKFTNESVWPMYLQINELPPQERIQQLVTCGLWFHKKKPDMSVFLDPFVDMMKKVKIQIELENVMKNVSVHVISCCVDSSARPGMQGIKQFNGYLGCNWCLHPGEYYAGSMRYPIKLDVPARTHEETVRIMTEVDLSVPVDGIKHPSPFINVEHFNMVHGFLVDYFHAVLIGAGEQVYTNFFDMMSTNDIAELDDIVMKIALPKQVSKMTREVSKRKDWSAREKENFILYHSVPLFQLKLEDKFVKYWKLFVDALYILLKDEISVAEIDDADEKLHLFVAKTQKYFGLCGMTFNVHQMLHLSESVLNWGPLWSHSCFGFEAANKHILQAIKSARGVPNQVVRFVNLNHAELVLKEHVLKNVSFVVKSFCENIIECRLRTCYQVNGNTYFGQKNKVEESTRSLHGLSSESYQFFKLIKNNSLYARVSKENLRSNNSFALLKMGKFFAIDYFIVDLKKKIEITFGHFVKVTDTLHMSNHLKLIQSIVSDQIHIKTSHIEKVAVFVKINEQHSYIIPVPNNLHYN